MGRGWGRGGEKVIKGVDLISFLVIKGSKTASKTIIRLKIHIIKIHKQKYINPRKEQLLALRRNKKTKNV